MGKCPLVSLLFVSLSDCLLSCLFCVDRWLYSVGALDWLILPTPSLLLGSVPEQIKPSVSQPQPASANNGTSTATSTNNNAKRAAANNQPPPQPPQLQPQPQPPQALPRYPREVPPRFRHQEHKQLLKRGQHFPAIAANLGSAVKVLSSPSESSVLPALQPPENGEAPSGKAPPGEVFLLGPLTSLVSTFTASDICGLWVSIWLYWGPDNELCAGSWDC